MTSFNELSSFGEKLARAMSDYFDYGVIGINSKQLNNPTRYKGKGRPRKTDYILWEHPLDKKVTKKLFK